jgi:hypothetical protein
MLFHSSTGVPVVGTVEPTITFDDRFRAASEHVRARWKRIALALGRRDAATIVGGGTR